jgi:uncharacterized protein YuzE
MLNYDNFLDINEDSKIQVLEVAQAKEVVNSEKYKSIVSELTRMLAVELLFE